MEEKTMLRPRHLLACVALFALTTACSRNVPSSQNADVAAVRSVEAAWVKDIATKDVDKYVSYYSDDASVLLPNQMMIAGKDNIKAALKPMLADPNFALTFQSTRGEASKSGDFVYVIGTYSMTTSSPRDQKPVTDQGKYLTVFKKQADGSWKAVADMVNSDLPAPSEHPQAAPQPKKHKTHSATRVHKRRRA
jgi:uncharacterized protein (TIGR02246 family)